MTANDPTLKTDTVHYARLGRWPVAHHTQVSPSNTDWGDLRSPSDPDGDGQVPLIAVPNKGGEKDNQRYGRRYYDHDGFESSAHSGTLPIKHILERDIDDLTDDERDRLLIALIEKERKKTNERDAVSLEREKFSLQKDKTRFTMLKYIVTGFSGIAGLTFVALVAVLIMTSFDNGKFNDSSVLASIMNSTIEVIRILFGPGQ